MKEFYIARDFDGFQDDIRYSLDRREAMKAAYDYIDDRITRKLDPKGVTLETYRLDIPEDDARSADQLWHDDTLEEVFFCDPDEVIDLSKLKLFLLRANYDAILEFMEDCQRDLLDRDTIPDACYQVYIWDDGKLEREATPIGDTGRLVPRNPWRDLYYIASVTPALEEWVVQDYIDEGYTREDAVIDTMYGYAEIAEALLDHAIYEARREFNEQYM